MKTQTPTTSSGLFEPSYSISEPPVGSDAISHGLALPIPFLCVGCLHSVYNAACMRHVSSPDVAILPLDSRENGREMFECVGLLLLQSVLIAATQNTDQSG